MSRRDFVTRGGILGAAAAMGVTDAIAAGTRPAEAMPKIRLGALEVSRLILGTNPIAGAGHPSFLRSKAMWTYYGDPEHVWAVLDEAARLGVTAVMGPTSGRWPGLWKQYRRQGGKLKIWIARVCAKVQEVGIKQAAGRGARAILITCGRTSSTYRRDRYRTYRKWIDEIKACDLPAGFASNRPDTLARWDESPLPADFFVQSVYRLARPSSLTFRKPDREQAFETIGRVRRPVIAFKILAAGTRDARESFRQTFRHLAAKDGVCVGVFPKDDRDQVREDCKLTVSLSGRPPSKVGG
jgi:hypothetical protein